MVNPNVEYVQSKVAEEVSTVIFFFRQKHDV